MAILILTRAHCYTLFSYYKELQVVCGVVCGVAEKDRYMLCNIDSYRQFYTDFVVQVMGLVLQLILVML
jgi:hypothetical protein